MKPGIKSQAEMLAKQALKEAGQGQTIPSWIVFCCSSGTDLSLAKGLHDDFIDMTKQGYAELPPDFRELTQADVGFVSEDGGVLFDIGAGTSDNFDEGSSKEDLVKFVSVGGYSYLYEMDGSITHGCQSFYVASKVQITGDMADAATIDATWEAMEDFLENNYSGGY